MGDVNKLLIIAYDALHSDSKIPVRGLKRWSSDYAGNHHA